MRNASGKIMRALDAAVMTPFATLHHRRGQPLVLPNAWDAASARIFEAAGFPAIATSSAAVAWALGYADGERTAPDEMIAAIGRIAAAVRCLVSADIEAGYAADTDRLIAFAERTRDAGAVGINLEDWDPRRNEPMPPDVAAARVAALKSHCGEALFVNARTDLYLHAVGDPNERFAAARSRLEGFVAAGADGIFVPGIADAPTIGAFVAAFPNVPLNVLAGPATPTVAELAALGVARVSVGGAPMRRILGQTRAIATELFERGTFSFTHTEPTISYDELNALFERR